MSPFGPIDPCSIDFDGSLAAVGGCAPFNFAQSMGETVQRQNFASFLKAGISQDCINALTYAFGPNAIAKVQNAIDSTTFFDVNELAAQPSINYWGSIGAGPVPLGAAFDSTGSGARTIGGSGPGVQPGIYSRGGISTFQEAPYFMLHELTHVVQDLTGETAPNLDFALTNKLGLDATPGTASTILSNFFNSLCAGFKKQ